MKSANRNDVYKCTNSVVVLTSKGNGVKFTTNLNKNILL